LRRNIRPTDGTKDLLNKTFVCFYEENYHTVDFEAHTCML
jgi:hypothetical protein